MLYRHLLTGTALSLGFAALPALAQDHGQHTMMGGAAPSAVVAADQPPLFELGTHSYAVTTAVPETQTYFDQGLRLAYGFNHGEAQRAFRYAQALDPSCAMCFWGEAYVLGPNINAPMDPSANEPALAAISQAVILATGANDREQALIAALAQRYSADPAADRAALDLAYADAMAEVAAQFPDDMEIQTLFAEAIMDTQPWDYWEADGVAAKGRAGEAVAAIERVLAANPEHPGAIHFYIHLVEASTTPERAVPYAERLAALMPAAGHIVHMPGHIYFRIGRYLDALEANVDAVAADEAYIAQASPVGIYPLAYYPHNVHFLLSAAAMAGDAETTVESADKLATLISPELAAIVPLAQPVMQAPYFGYAMFADLEKVLALPQPDGRLPFVVGAWHYARGVALAQSGDIPGATAEADALATLAKMPDVVGLADYRIPATEVLTIAEAVVRGRIARDQGDLAAARDHFARAADLQDGVAYMEPPYWYYPVRQSLGAVLLEQGDAAAAKAEFEAALERAPNNGWALFGLAQVAAAQGDAAAKAEAERLLEAAWSGDPETLSLGRL